MRKGICKAKGGMTQHFLWKVKQQVLLRTVLARQEALVVHHVTAMGGRKKLLPGRAKRK